MLKKILTWIGLLIALIIICSVGNDLMTYQIFRQAGVNFGKYHEYSGVIHIHTQYSDGSGTYASIARTCDSLGLHFAIFTDHNTVQPFRDSLNRRFGMTLVVPAVEISTDGEHGHFLVIGDSVPLIPRNGVTSDSVFHQAVRDRSTIILAHVFHPRNTLDWDNWNIGNFTGIELYNFDEGWRNTLNFFRINKLIGACIAYRFQDESLNYLLDFPEKEMRRFDELNQKRKVVGIGSLDAHSNLKIGKNSYIDFPSYVSLFNLVQTVVVTREPFNGNYGHDREIILRAINQGNSFVSFSGLEEARGFLFTVMSGDTEAVMGDSIRLTDQMHLDVILPDSGYVEAEILRDGTTIGKYDNKESINLRITAPGEYRVQVFQKRAMLPLFIKRSFPWILSNPIYVYR
ncbi:MAG TPA: hypothetical protein VIS48_02585 [Candidatus Kryptonia bacterium]